MESHGKSSEEKFWSIEVESHPLLLSRLTLINDGKLTEDLTREYLLTRFSNVRFLMLPNLTKQTIVFFVNDSFIIFTITTRYCKKIRHIFESLLFFYFTNEFFHQHFRIEYVIDSIAVCEYYMTIIYSLIRGLGGNVHANPFQYLSNQQSGRENSTLNEKHTQSDDME